jgi:hypothetical protein
MGLIPWVLSSIGPAAGSRRRVDRWANPHVERRRTARPRCRPRPGGRTARVEENGNRPQFERREAWNAGR